MELRPLAESLRFEGVKHAAAAALGALAEYEWGERLIARYAAGAGRMADERLRTSAAGLEFENPLVVGAGWDKTGEAARGLYTLGFAGVEVGTVTAFPQPGNPRPRLWTFGPNHGVAINRMGFNSPGMDIVRDNLDRLLPRSFPLGINIGKNKLAPDVAAPQLHAAVAAHLYMHASYFVINPSSPNTPGLRRLQQAEPLREIVQATQAAMDEQGPRKPLLVKIAPDLAWHEIDDIIEVVDNENCAGIVAVNTSVRRDGVQRYGARWANEPGGLSGAHPQYERRATDIVRYIHRQAGHLALMGVGGVHDLPGLVEKLQAGASVVQVVTAIRSSRGRVAARLNGQLLELMDKENIRGVSELVGSAP